MDRTVTFPRMSYYTDIIKEIFENLNVEVILPPPITEKTIKLGVKHSSVMMCFPYKITLGSFLEVLEIAKQKGIKLTYMGVGTSNVCMHSCRFQLYFEMQKRICEDLGYDFDTIFIEKKGPRPIGFIFGVINAFKKANPKNSYLKVIKEVSKGIKKMNIEDKKHNYFDWNDNKRVRIGIVGEYYTVVEPSINYDIMNKLKEMNINAHTFINYSNELGIYKESIPHEFIKQAKDYFHGVFRAHGDTSYQSLYFYKHHNFDAVIHLLPLSCMPESTAQNIMDLTAKRLDIPLYTFPLDEENFKTGFEMRLNSIMTILKRRKEALCS